MRSLFIQHTLDVEVELLLRCAAQGSTTRRKSSKNMLVKFVLIAKSLQLNHHMKRASLPSFHVNGRLKKT
jgi:S-adenosylmethionine:diacylglycerol 3-amino-3-carboxypropyl transferase